MGHKTDRGDDLGDVLAALATIEPFTSDDPEADDRLMMAAEIGGGRHAVLTGVGTLIRMFTDRLTAIGRERGHPDAPLFIPVVVNWLRETELVTEEIIPTMAGALTAATLGQHPIRWRETLRPDPRPRTTALDLHHRVPGPPGRRTNRTNRQRDQHGPRLLCESDTRQPVRDHSRYQVWDGLTPR